MLCMEYISANRYFRECFGRKVYKVAIDGGFTCPNRDGTKGTGGCIFCSGRGSGDFASDPTLSIADQVKQGTELIKSKLPKGEKVGIMAYFQNFTNTYAGIETLRSKYLEAIHINEVVGLSIATRPDCLDDEVVNLLSEINQIKPVWVELGLQTIKEESVRYIRRGYENDEYIDAVNRLSQHCFHIITHVILGLPGETVDDMLDTVSWVKDVSAKYAIRPLQFGIKLQLLHIIRGTDLERDFRNGLFETLTMEEYADVIGKAVRIIDNKLVIHRITGDGDKRTLVAPMWSADKKKVLNSINRVLRQA